MDRTDMSARERTPAPRERAISEVLSYSLIFGLIVASIGIVTVGGLGSLQSAQTNEQLSNAERAFDVLHDNFGDVHSEGAPSRATEISLGDSQLFFDENVTMEIQLTSKTIKHDIRPVVFRVDGDRQLVYEAGAVMRVSRDGGFVLNSPPFTVTGGSTEDDGQVHLTIVKTTSPDVESMGSTTVLLQGESRNRSVLASDVGGGEDLVEIRIDSPRADIWGDYFDSLDYCTASVTSTTATCDVDPDFDEPKQLYVTLQQIRIQLIQ